MQLILDVLQTCLQDEILAISDKVVIRADDLLNWCDDTINWRWGLRATTIQSKAPECDSIVKTEAVSDSIKTEPDGKVSTVDGSDGETKMPGVRSLKNSLLDFADIEAEKGKKKKKNVHLQNSIYIHFTSFCHFKQYFILIFRT